MKDALLRTQKDRLLAPFAQRFLAGTHPTWLSFLGAGIGLLSAGAVLQGALGWGLAFWLGNRLLDGLDGLTARLHGRGSDLGGYLDLMLDFLVYLAVPISFVVADPAPARIWALIFLLASFQINALSWTLLAALLEKRRRTSSRLTSLEMPPGLIEGAETVLFYSLFFLLPQAVGPLFWAMGALVFVTAAQRVWWAVRHL